MGREQTNTYYIGKVEQKLTDQRGPPEGAMDVAAVTWEKT